jgi:glycine cleavage system H protein
VNFPDDLLYSPDHLWVRVQEGVSIVGLSDYAQDHLGKIVYVDLPGIGQTVIAGEEMGFTVEGAKSMTDLISPVTGKVVEINKELADDPTPLHQDPYVSGWMAKIELVGPLSDELMEAAAYRQRVGA